MAAEQTSTNRWGFFSFSAGDEQEIFGAAWRSSLSDTVNIQAFAAGVGEVVGVGRVASVHSEEGRDESARNSSEIVQRVNG